MSKQVFKRIGVLAFAVLLISACQPTPAAVPTETSTAMPVTATSAPPTATPQIDNTPTPPAATPTSEPTPTAISNITLDKTKWTGDYLGQTPPGQTAELFAPEVLAISGKNHHTLSFSPDGREVYFTRDPDRVTMFMRQENGQWTEPQAAPFNGREALFSPDGSRLFFNDGDLWFVEKTGGGWSEPQNLGEPINSSEHDYYASITADGALYFSRIVEERGRIFRSKLTDGRYTEIEEIDLLDATTHNYHPFIAPDESYLIFNSQRSGGYGAADLYISFRKEDGTWSKPRNLGNAINSSDSDLCPVVSPDGEYFFFTRYREGAGDIYWVSSAFIGQLKADEMQ